MGYPTLALLEYPIRQNILGPCKLRPEVPFVFFGYGQMFVFVRLRANRSDS